MSRNIDVSESNHEPFDPTQWTPIAPAAWTDYDGVMPYGDFDLDVDASGNGVITEKARYADGFGTFGRQLLDAQGQVSETRYLHGDLIRSTNLTTDGAGAAAQTVAYTAFGELVGEDGQGGTRIGADPPTGFPRYQYAGGRGYEADLLTLGGAPTGALPPIRLLHVGARWYQPDIGRFIQRDPSGLTGGINQHAYAQNCPATIVDPTGQTWSRVVGVGLNLGLAVYHARQGNPGFALGHVAGAVGSCFGVPGIGLIPKIIHHIATTPAPNPNPPETRYEDFHNHPNEGVRGKAHPPGHCALNPGIWCNQNPNCPNYGR